MPLSAFFSYIFLTAFTPGPNNIMAMTNAGKYGFKKSLRFCVGVLLGFLFVMTGCAVFTTLLYRFIPRIEPAMVWVGAGYILWLAWTIYRDKSGGEESSGARSNSIAAGMMLQFVNVKVILYGITAISTFVLPYCQTPYQIAFFVMILILMGFVGTCCWALFGSVFQKLFARYRKQLNAAMALLLVYCAVSTVASI